ncbi:hypothetical protein, partial [Celeribacter sp.]
STSTCRSFATISSGLCLFCPIRSSSIWLESLLQEGPLFWGQTTPRQTPSIAPAISAKPTARVSVKLDKTWGQRHLAKRADPA